MAVVRLTSDAREDVRDLDGAAKKRVLKAMKKLEDSPEQRGQPLGSQSDSDLTTFRKLVVGDRDYRIIYRVEADGQVVVIWVVGARVDRECYEIAASRLKLYGSDKAMAKELAGLLEVAWTH